MQGTLLERMDRETRMLAILAVATLVFVIAAAFALTSSARVVETAFEPEPFFPELAQKLGTVREITIETKDRSLRVARNEQGQWVLPEKDGYPVRTAPLRETLLGLGELTKVQPATANAEWHKELRLKAPDEEGGATRITLKREDGGELVSLLVGEEADLPDISGLDSYYVRLPGEMQSWLARGTLSLRLDPAAWIVTDIVPVPAEKIRSATVTPPEGAAYTVAREDEKAESFSLKTMPPGKELRGPRAADGLAQAIAGLKIQDARLASDFNFENAPSVRYRTFDGLEITVRTLELGEEDIWASIKARYDGQPGGDAAKSFDSSSLAADINKRVAGWAFKLPVYAGRQMRLPLSDLVKDTEPAEGTAGEASTSPAPAPAAAAETSPAPDQEGGSGETKASAEEAPAPADSSGEGDAEPDAGRAGKEGDAEQEADATEGG